MRSLLAFMALGLSLVASSAVPSLAQNAAPAPGCQAAHDFMGQMMDAGVDFVLGFEQDETLWYRQVNLNKSAGKGCPPIPANLLARYRGEPLPNGAHKRMNCHLAFDHVMRKHNFDVEKLSDTERYFVGDYINAMESNQSCPAVEGQIAIEAQGNEISSPHDWLDMAMANGDSDAWLEYGILLTSKVSAADGLDAIERASALGNPWADMQLAAWYRDGVGGMVDPARSHQYALRAANAGLSWGMVSAARNFDTGYGTKVDKKQALQWYEQAAERGIPTVLVLAATLYYEGKGGVKKDLNEAARLARLAVDAGETNAMAFLGLVTIARNPTEAGLTEGEYWINKAAARGNATAITAMRDNLPEIRRTVQIEQERKERARQRALNYSPAPRKACPQMRHCVNYRPPSGGTGYQVCNSGTDWWNC